MSQTDVSDIATAVSGIQIDGPTASGRIELNDADPYTILPGEIDSAVGSQVPAAATDEDEDDAPEDGDEPEDEDQNEEEPLDDGAAVAVAKESQDALFHAGQYDTRPRIDGQGADELVIAFSGSVKFPADDADGIALFKDLRLGKWVDLHVSGHVAARQGSYKEKADGETVIAGKSTIRIDSLTLKRPEDL